MDAFVFTEYVESSAHADFVARLGDIGFASTQATKLTPGQNQILIASRVHTKPGSITPPEGIDDSVPSNALHLCLGDFHLIGFRMPAFSKGSGKLKRQVWEWVRNAAAGLRSKQAVIIGDMNTQIDDEKAYCGDCIKTVCDDGWSVGIPSEGYSWKHARSGTERRIDFAFLSPGLRCSSAEYSWDFVQRNQLTSLKVGIPDHALLRIEVEPAKVERTAV